MKKLLNVLFIALIAVTLTACSSNEAKTIDQIIIENIKEDLTVTNEVSEDLDLPTLVDGYPVKWVSSNTTVLTNEGKITRPNKGESDATVTLTATITVNEETASKEFTIVVKAATETVDKNPTDTCPADYHMEDGNCVKDTTDVLSCPTGQHIENNACVDDDTTTYSGYYQGAANLTGEQLKTFLHELIDDHTVLSYDSLKYSLPETDRDPNNSNKMILLYSGDSVSKTWDSADTWNREHVWPKSLGGFKSDAAGSDMHHLRPTYTNVNSTRGNKIFGTGGSLVSSTDDCYTTSTTFEPRDEVKGDVARMLFYMAVRYEGNDGAAGSDLELVYGNTSSSNGKFGNLEILLQWHIDDPVDDFERNRNEVIFGYQHNRNPFIDHPEFVALIWN